jgi:CBS domain-containing protein
MPTNGLTAESLLFIPVESLCRSPVVTCGPDLEVVEIARLMQQHDISGLVVVAAGAPVGIVTLRDLRNLIAEAGGKIIGTRARDIMRTQLVTIRRQDYVFSAIFKMAKYNIHRLVVLDDREQLAGVITDTDLLNLQTRTPLYLTQEIEGADSIEQLRQLNQRILDMVSVAARAGADTRSLVQLISHFNDVCTHRLIALLDQEEGLRLPAGAAYLALGSEGRGEQTLRTDQDSAMVYRDDLPPGDLRAIERFANRLVEALETIGVPRCPGDTMASNPRWRRTLSEWKQLLDHWITVPKPDNMVNFGMFQDLRALHGDTALEGELHDHILASVQRHSLFLPYVARNVVRFKPPLGMFGRIRVERRGPNRGKVDLKKAGIFALTEGVSLLALEAGIVGGSTWDKIDRLKGLGVMSTRDLEMVDEAFTHLVQLRLQRQLRALAAGSKPSNCVDPLILSDKERDLFRQALKEVGQFLKIIHDRYQLDFISR